MTSVGATIKNSPYEVVFDQSPWTGFALLGEFADQGLLGEETIPEELIKQGYKTLTIPTEIINKDVEDEAAEELGPQPLANFIFLALFIADTVENIVFPWSKNE